MVDLKYFKHFFSGTNWEISLKSIIFITASNIEWNKKNIQNHCHLTEHTSLDFLIVYVIMLAQTISLPRLSFKNNKLQLWGI